MSYRRSVLLTGGAAILLAAGINFALGRGESLSAPQDKKAEASKGKPATADEPEKDGRDADRAAIRKSSEAFSRAAAKKDAKACAAFWTEQGEYFGDDRGTIRGRAAIEKAFAEHFKEHPMSTTAVRIDSIRFISKANAIETGILQSDPGGGELPTSTKYSVLHVKENGTWRIAFAREWAAEKDRLEDLEWLIGKWSAKVENREVTLDHQWSPKRTFIRGTFETTEKGEVTMTGIRVIGMDPVPGQLRTWTFEHGGGFGESYWQRDGDRWLLESTGTLPDGGETYAINVIKRIDANAFTWQSTDRSLDGEALPDTEPVKLTRVKDN